MQLDIKIAVWNANGLSNHIVFSHREVLTQKLVLTLKQKIKSGFTIQNYCVNTIVKT